MICGDFVVEKFKMEIPLPKMELQSRDELNVSRDDLKINKINVTGKPTIGKTRFDILHWMKNSLT